MRARPSSAQALFLLSVLLCDTPFLPLATFADTALALDVHDGQIDIIAKNMKSRIRNDQKRIRLVEQRLERVDSESLADKRYQKQIRRYRGIIERLQQQARKIRRICLKNTGYRVCPSADRWNRVIVNKWKRRFDMKFRDLFLPKLAHSNPMVRLEAVASEQNVDVLKKVSQKDDDAKVRALARKRIEELELETA